MAVGQRFRSVTILVGEGDHEHAEVAEGVHAARRGTTHDAAALLRTVLGRAATIGPPR